MPESVESGFQVLDRLFVFLGEHGLPGLLAIACAVLAVWGWSERSQRLEIDRDYKRLLLELVAVNRQLEHERSAG